MTDSALSAYRAARKDQLVRNEARHIRTKISVARGSRHDAGVRWPFELLQNAIDAGPRSGREHVEISLRGEGTNFVFEHDELSSVHPNWRRFFPVVPAKSSSPTTRPADLGPASLSPMCLLHARPCREYQDRRRRRTLHVVLDRSGDEDAIVANIEACEVALAAAEPCGYRRYSVRQIRILMTDDRAMLELGITSLILRAVPATCDRLGRVNLQGECWEAGQATVRTIGDSVILERGVTCRRGDRTDEYQAVRVASTTAPNAGAIVVLSRENEGWRVRVPGPDFPRVFCRYPIRSSAFLPINVILDAPFDLDQERRQILFDKDENAKRLFRSAVGAAVRVVRVAFDEGWKGRHWLARAEPSPSSFAGRQVTRSSGSQVRCGFLPTNLWRATPGRDPQGIWQAGGLLVGGLRRR